MDAQRWGKSCVCEAAATSVRLVHWSVRSCCILRNHSRFRRLGRDFGRGIHCLDSRKLGFINEAQSGIVEFAQSCFRWLEAGEFHQVTTLEEFSEALLLIRRQQVG